MDVAKELLRNPTPVLVVLSGDVFTRKYRLHSLIYTNVCQSRLRH